MKQINGKIYHVHGLEELTLKMSILQKAIYKFNAISIKIPMAFYTQLEKNDPKIDMEPQKTPNTQRRTKTVSILPEFKLYYRAIIIKGLPRWHF